MPGGGGRGSSYLAGPDGGDQVAVVFEDVEDLDDPTGVPEHGDAGVGEGQVQGEVVGGLERGALLEQHKQNDGVPEPGQPACRTTRQHTRTLRADKGLYGPLKG